MMMMILLLSEVGKFALLVFIEPDDDHDDDDSSRVCEEEEPPDEIFFCHEFGFEPFFHTNWIHILQWTSQVIDTGNSSTSFWVGFVCLFCAGRRTLAKLSKSSKLGRGGAAATWKLRANGNPTGKDSIGDKATWGKEEEWQDIQSNCRADGVDQCLCCTAVSQAGTIETRHSQGIQGSSPHPHRWPDRSHARDPPESIWPHHPPRPYHLQACLSLSPILPNALQYPVCASFPSILQCPAK